MSSTDIEKWLRTVQPHLTNGGVEFIGGEPGVSLGEGEPRILVASLCTYEQAHADNIHYKVGDAVVSAGGSVDYCYMPPRRDFHFFESYHIPAMFGVNSKESATEFDVVLFIWRDTLEAFNLSYLIEKSGIHLFKDVRLNHGGPLLGVVGEGALGAHMVSEMVDFALLGDVDVVVPGFVGAFSLGNQDLREQLVSLRKKVPGFLEPDKNLKAKVARAKTLPPPPSKYPVPYLDSPEHVFQVEMARGCPAECLHCFEGWTQKPYREHAAIDIIDSAMQGQIDTGVVTMRPTAPMWCYHSEPYSVLNALGHNYQEFSAVELRPDIVVREPALVEILGHKRVQKVVISLDGVSGRLRRFFHKNIHNQEVLDSLRIVSEYIKNIELSILLTGRETKEDLDEFIGLLHRISELEANFAVVARVVINRRMTPLQWSANEAAMAEDTFVPIADACRTLKFKFKFGTLKLENHVRQVMEKGGRELRDPILDMGEKGFLYYGIVTAEFKKQLSLSMRRYKVKQGRYFDELPADHEFPWDNIDTGVSKEYMRRRYEEGRRGWETSYCMPLRGEESACHSCGACSTKESKQLVEREVEPQRAEHFHIAERGCRWRIIIDITDPMYRTVPKRAFLQGVIKAVMERHPELVPHLLKVAEHSTQYMGQTGKEWFHGLMAIDLLFTVPADEPDLKGMSFNGWSIVGAKAVDVGDSLRQALDLVVYEVPTGSFRVILDPSASYYTITQFISTKEGSVREREVRIEKDDVHFVHKISSGMLILGIRPELDPFFTLEAVTKIKRFKWQRQNVRVAGLYRFASRASAAERNFFVDEQVCSSCSRSLEIPLSGERPTTKKCLSCQITSAFEKSKRRTEDD